MQLLSTLLPILGLSLSLSLPTTAYVLQDDYGTSNAFFDQFTFFTDTDPTHGFVKYIDRGAAQNAGLVSADGGSVYMGVDFKNQASGGRQSVRISSNKSYNHGLFILDLQHMPGGICGTWPAYWLLGPNWPNNGEIDIIEGVHEQTTNLMAAHTSDGCTIANTGFSGALQSSNCYVSAPNQASNVGCSISAGSAQTYGAGFNGGGGGVYATEWTGSAISIWFWPRNAIPGDVSAGNPNPAGWGTPVARFAGGCDVDAKFRDMQIVFDTTFCGDWAGSVWNSGSCASKAGSCTDFVANNPGAFRDAYWRINSLKVYRQ
ncbi:glycoside hydrolase family 16 protein [Aspergillus candidus]|uniref:endo-1,3(4)-beta-glucanase n=1 Tax=Aspergillus candidus TaxID=41067 RepID=A0A2I2FLE3_ASPCN|nr:putative endo-1,3(4)-beta-glucanase [Aspergillus candidus]PLB41424.1 putative endo-1,3(4)-beta-glucanase [Aspergillus candidus]